MKLPACRLPEFTRRLTAMVVLFAGIALLAGALSAQTQAGTKKKEASKTSRSVGFSLSGEATEKDLGLPLYPGSKPYKEDADSDSGLHMAMSGGSFGFKLVALKLESADSPEKIAAFYRKSMSKYGTVLDCSKAGGGTDKKDESKKDADKDDGGKKDAGKKNDKSNTLTCEDDKPEKGGYAYKVGTKQKMHVVAVEPNGKSTLISLVYVESPENDKEQE